MIGLVDQVVHESFNRDALSSAHAFARQLVLKQSYW